jgi:hypothetical protein
MYKNISGSGRGSRPDSKMQHVNENYGSDTDPNIDRIEDGRDNYYHQPLEKKTKKKSKKKKTAKERHGSGGSSAGPSMREEVHNIFIFTYVYK